MTTFILPDFGLVPLMFYPSYGKQNIPFIFIDYFLFLFFLFTIQMDLQTYVAQISANPISTIVFCKSHIYGSRRFTFFNEIASSIELKNENVAEILGFNTI